MNKYNIDPELRYLAEMNPNQVFDDPITARKNLETYTDSLNANLDESGVSIQDLIIDSEPHIPLRIYRPKNQPSTTAGILYIHGGGFTMGSIKSEHSQTVSLCRDLGVVIVSVGYRLAPENPFPAGLEDCYTALCWMSNNSSSLDVDPNRIAVFGQSAGGGLSAGLTLLSMKRRGPAICFQYLGIPTLDDRLETVSMTQFKDTPFWNRPNALFSWRYYLGYEPGSDKDISITAAPARSTTDDLRGLPPACITTMEFDPLRDEGIEYALKLLQAGVSVELHSYSGTFHGSAMATSATISRREQADIRAVLRHALSLNDA